MKIGIAVYCTVCGRKKKPHGRSAPVDSYLCDEQCAGYQDEPAPGCLWPGETESDFGFPVCANAVSEDGAYAAQSTPAGGDAA